jgi:ABC-type transport system substrate-binding protein
MGSTRGPATDRRGRMSELNHWSRGLGRSVSRRSVLRGSAIGAAGLAGAALIGCGGEEAPPARPPTGATPAPRATVAPTEQVAQAKMGGTFRTADDAVAPHYSPFHPGVDPSWHNTFRRINGYYDQLWHLRDVDDPAQQFYMRLAKSFEQVDETTVVVQMHDAHFHDNPASRRFNSEVGGRKLTAEDVVARYEFLKVPPASSNTLLQRNLTVSAVDDTTIEYKMGVPWAFFLEDNEGAMVRGYELPQEMLDEQVLKEEPPIGTGPFMFQSYQVGSQERAVRNPNYFTKDRPYLDGLQFTIVGDNAAQEAAFRSAQIDRHTFQDIKERDAVTRDLGDKIVPFTYPTSSGMALILNIRKPVFQDIRFREAIYRAIDIDRIINVVYFGDGFKQGVFPSARPERTPLGYEAVAQLREHDKAKAKQLVDAVKADGLYNGEELFFMLPVEAQTWVDGGRLVAEDLKDVGINTQTEAIVRNIYLQRAGPKPADGSPSDFDITMTVFLNYDHFTSAPGSFWQNAGLEDSEIDALIDQITTEMDLEQRRDLSHRFEMMMAEKYSNFVPMLGTNIHAAYYSHVKGVDFDKSRSGLGGWQLDTWFDT